MELGGVVPGVLELPGIFELPGVVGVPDPGFRGLCRLVPVPGELGLVVLGGDVGEAFGGWADEPGVPGAPGVPGLPGAALPGGAAGDAPGDLPAAVCAPAAADRVMPRAIAVSDEVLMENSYGLNRIPSCPTRARRKTRKSLSFE